MSLLKEHKELEATNAETSENLKEIEEKHNILNEKYHILLENQKILLENQQKGEVLGGQVRQLEEEKKRLVAVNGKFQGNLRDVLGKFYVEMREEKRIEGVKPSEILLELERIVGWIGDMRYGKGGWIGRREEGERREREEEG